MSKGRISSFQGAVNTTELRADGRTKEADIIAIMKVEQSYQEPIHFIEGCKRLQTERQQRVEKAKAAQIHERKADFDFLTQGEEKEDSKKEVIPFFGKGEERDRA